MTRNYLRGIGFGALALWAAPGCGSVCGDDGWVWNQADNPACAPANDGSATDSGSGTEGTTAGDTPSTVTEDPTTDEPTAGSATMGGSLHCKDADGDGHGDPDMCMDEPFPGSVPNNDDCADDNADAFPGSAEAESDTACMEDADGDGWGDTDPDPGVEPGTDCADDNVNAFPGSAEEESGEACMEDADGDGWGDTMPGPGVDPGTDCNDDNMGIFPGAAEEESAEACMQDSDGDGWGDSTPEPGAEPGTDCDDGNEFTFPGAAPNDSPEACMKDEDGDDWGDDFGGDPPPPDVVPGTDCNDQSAFTFPGAAELDSPEACMADEDDDGYGATEPPEGGTPGTDCADNDAEVHVDCAPCRAGVQACIGDDLIVCSDGGNVISMETCEFGCDDAGLKCWDPLEVEAGPTVCIDVGGSTQLGATAMGGDGAYTYDWTPFDTLDDPAIPDPTASPAGPTTYTVSVTDGEGSVASDNVTVYLNNLSLNLDPNICETFDFTGMGETDPDTLWQWNANTKELCQTVNGKGSALFCGWELNNATIKGTFSVKTIEDDDWVGFIWGLQDTDHFYLFTWKQIAQNFANCGGQLPTGMQVKVINVADPMMAPQTCADRHQNGDTVNSKMLVPTDQFYGLGWLDNTDYLFELTHKDTGEITIVVRNKLLNTIVAEKTFMDTTYPSGKFGMYTKSQISACFSDYKTFCIP